MEKKANEILYLVRRFIACMALLIVTIILEWCLMLGLILCVAYCSGYITLAPTDIEKGC